MVYAIRDNNGVSIRHVQNDDMEWEPLGSGESVEMSSNRKWPNLLPRINRIGMIVSDNPRHQPTTFAIATKILKATPSQVPV